MNRTPLKRKRETARRKVNPMPLPGAAVYTRVKDTRKNAKHLDWVRQQPCTFRHNGGCSGPIQAMHVRNGTDCGMGIKPDDKWTLPGCAGHHHHQHQIGERAFEVEMSCDLKALAIGYYDRSPYGEKL